MGPPYSDSEDEMKEEELTGLASKMARQSKLMKQRAGMEDDDEDDDEEEKQKVVRGSGKKIYSDSEDEMEEEELTGLAAKMARQSKLMKQRVGMEDEDEDEDEEEKQKAVWGRGKKIYYGADNVNYEEQSSDEEAPLEQEAEFRELQQSIAASLRPEDFGYEDSEDDEEKEEQEDTFEEAARKTEKKTKKSNDNMITDDTIELKKDIKALSKKEQMEVLMSDAPELAGLTPELRDNLNELRSKVMPLLEKMRQSKGATEDGIRYVELKHTLLLSYCQAIVFYLLLKAEAKDVRDHPVVGRLVDLKLSIKRLQMIEEKMQKQIDKLLTSDMAGAEEEKSNSKEKDKKTKAMKKQEAAKAEGKSKKRKGVIATETNGRVEAAENAVGIESQHMLDERKRLEARAQGNHVVHVPSSNAERRKAKRQKSGTGSSRMAEDLEDDVENDKMSNGTFDGKPRTLSQVIAEAGRPFKKPQVISGDADLPVREDLADRRRKLEIQKTNKHIDSMDDSDDEVDDSKTNEPEEDDFYRQARLLKEAKEAAKQAKYSRMILTPVEEEDAEGKRSITWQMEKNRGLTPHRKKANKNPRKKYKLKHEKAVVRRKGQVRDIRAATTNYGGEASGIRTNISRSVRFKN